MQCTKCVVIIFLFLHNRNFQVIFCVLFTHFHQTCFVAFLWQANICFALAFFKKWLLQALFKTWHHIDQNFLWHKSVCIVLHNERRHNFVWCLWWRKNGVILYTQNFATTTYNHAESRIDVVRIKTKYVHFQKFWHICNSFFFEFFNHFESVTKQKCLFKVLILTVCKHFLLQYFFGFGGVTIQKCNCFVYDFCIFLFWNFVCARCKAKSQIKI